MEEVTQVYEVRSDTSFSCPICRWTSGRSVMDPGFDAPKCVNHMLEAHELRLLHVGQETTRDDRDNPWHVTEFVLGG